MSDNNEMSVEEHLNQLHEIIKQKNQIIDHLQSRVKNQEKQIDMLVLDAEEKHFHQIVKYYTQTYQKYMKHDRFLLLRVDEVQGNGIYLPKLAKIVHFGELELMNPQPNGLTQMKNQQNILNGVVNNLKQLNMNKIQSNSFQSSCKGLSMQIQQLKEKLKTYTTLVSQKSASRIEQMHKQDQTPNRNKDKQFAGAKSGRKIPQTPINKLNQYQREQRHNTEQKDKKGQLEIQDIKSNSVQKQKQAKDQEMQKSILQIKQKQLKNSVNNPNNSANPLQNNSANNSKIDTSNQFSTNPNPIPNTNQNFNPNMGTDVKQKIQTETLPSPSPVKKRSTTRRIFIRKN